MKVLYISELVGRSGVFVFKKSINEKINTYSVVFRLLINISVVESVIGRT
jgi:hypothetical protein